MTSGVVLAAAFYRATVRPILDERFPDVAFMVGRLGSGSDVLGYDDAWSTDHDWGCRLTVLVPALDAPLVDAVDEALEADLPDAFEGRPVRFPTTWDARVRHKVQVATLAAFVASRLGVDATEVLSPLDWLVVTGQSVLEITAGPVFSDPDGTLGELRHRLAWYPDDVWLYVLGAGWHRVAQELPLIGRTGERGDDTGSRLIAARVARDLRHLCFLIERRWPPYPKWTGAALAELGVASVVHPALAAALRADRWQDREAALADVAASILPAQAERGLPAATAATQPFFDRPFVTANPDIAASLRAPITDPMLRHLPPGLGSVEQWIDNVDILAHPDRRAAALSTYRALIKL
jgi:hypothetical protein